MLLLVISLNLKFQLMDLARWIRVEIDLIWVKCSDYLRDQLVEITPVLTARLPFRRPVVALGISSTF